MISLIQENGNSIFLTRYDEELIFQHKGFERSRNHHSESWIKLTDSFGGENFRICYLKLLFPNERSEISLFQSGTIKQLIEDAEFGFVLRIDDNRGKYTIWFPSVPYQVHFDNYQRITPSVGTSVKFHAQLKPDIKLKLIYSPLQDQVIVFPCVIMEDKAGQFFQEVRCLSLVERRLYRKSNWFFAKRPSDLWNYLIYGSIYDPRTHNKVGKRFKCQQCAYAWWNYFHLLQKETGKKIYSFLQDAIAYSVLLDMSGEGNWEHGFWSDDPETHARFHLDGLHLFLSQYQKTGESIWLEAVERGIAFILENMVDRFNDGSLWFLHDTIEDKMPHRFSSKLFGKFSGNSLCLNTHIQALTVLHRLCILIPNKIIYACMFYNGVNALRRVMEHQPADLFYKFLMPVVIKRIEREKACSRCERLYVSLQGHIIHKIYWGMRRRFPRLIYTSGFTERDLTLSCASDRYHLINLKDLLTLYKQEHFPWLRSYIKNGVSFIRTLDFTKALKRSPYYIEWIDILHLYKQTIEDVQPEEMDFVEQKIFYQMGGYSLDYNILKSIEG